MKRTSPANSTVLTDKAEAQALTERIRDAVDSLWSLLLEAHERKAWKALGYARAITTGQMTPDEAREMENRETKGGAAGELLMQGAMLPIEKLGQQPARGIGNGDTGLPPLDGGEGNNSNAA